MLCLILWIVKMKPDGSGLSVMLFCCSWIHNCASSWAREPPLCSSPSPMFTIHPPHGLPEMLPWRGKKWSFILVRTANWKLLTWHLLCSDYSPRACLLCSPFDKIRVFCNCNSQFPCWNEVAGWAVESVKPGFLQIYVWNLDFLMFRKAWVHLKCFPWGIQVFQAFCWFFSV